MKRFGRPQSQRPFPMDRRELIKAIALTAPVLALTTSHARAQPAISLVSTEDKTPSTGLLRITVRPPPGRDVPVDTVVVVNVAGRWIDVPKSRSNLVYERTVETGKSYDLEVRARGHRDVRRTISVAKSLAVARIYLVPNGWPTYILDGIEIPFEPRTRFAGVVVEQRLADQEVLDLNTRALAAGFRPMTRDPDTGEQLDNVNGSVLYFMTSSPSVDFFSFAADPVSSHDRVLPDAVLELRDVFANYGGRVGAPVQTESGVVRIIDSQYVVQFPNAVSDDVAQRYAESLGGAIVPEAERMGDFWLIEFEDPQHIGRHLSVMEREYRSGQVLSGEPNLLFQIQSHAPPHGAGSLVSLIRMFMCQSSSTNDIFGTCQNNLMRQRVREAWCFIEDIDPTKRFGSANITIASIDNGITFDSFAGTSAHPDVDVERLDYCYSVEGDLACSGEPALDSGKWHGMATYGLISAEADNEFGIAGVAPGVKHVAIEFTGVMQDTKNYADTLAWVGGIRESPPARASKAPPIDQPADIINCSHGLDGMVLQARVKHALKTLACHGRSGRGTIVVYSAGNNNCYIEDDQTLATFPYTIGVCNTDAKDGVESRWVSDAVASRRPRGSNYGPYVDLCANGQRAPTLSPRIGLGQPPVCDSGTDAGEGLSLHGGTSAAAAIVSGAAALVLTVNPDLNWQQVCRVLCASAEKIDCDNAADVLDCLGHAQTGRWRPGMATVAPAGPPACATLPKGMTWFSDFYGYGRLDVLAAVTLAKEVEALPGPPCDL